MCVARYTRLGQIIAFTKRLDVDKRLDLIPRTQEEGKMGKGSREANEMRKGEDKEG